MPALPSGCRLALTATLFAVGVLPFQAKTFGIEAGARGTVIRGGEQHSIGGNAGGFRMPTIAPPAIPDGVSYKNLGPWALAPGMAGKKQLRLENNWLLLRGGNVSGFQLTDIDARSYGVILRGTHLPGLRVERVRVVQGHTSSAGGGIATVWNGADGAVFQDLTYIGDPAKPAPNGTHPWAGIALAGKNANDIGHFLIDRFDFQNLITSQGDRYANADGIATERGYTGTISNGRVMGASDACLDIKGDVHVDNVFLKGCREGIKSWSNQKHGLIEMGTNKVAAILGAGSPSEVRSIYIDKLILDGDPAKPILRAERGVFLVTIGTLVASKDQKLMDEHSFKGSAVKVLRRINRS